MIVAPAETAGAQLKDSLSRDDTLAAKALTTMCTPVLKCSPVAWHASTS